MAEVPRAPSIGPGFEEWFAGVSRGAMLQPLGRLLDRASGIAELKRFYQTLPRDVPFWDSALQALGVELAIVGGDLSRVPPSGPLAIVANHPFGGIDGLILVSLLRRVRPDLKLLGNYLLARLPEFKDVLIPVDPFGISSKRRMNAAAARAAVRWLRAGGAVASFPAGEVSYKISAGGQPVDSTWPPGTARLVRQGNADVLPVFFHGQNSAVFRLAGWLHPLVRTALLAREVLNKRGHRIDVSIGSCIPAARLARFDSPEELISYARLRTYAMADANHETAPPRRPAPVRHPPGIAPSEPADALEREIDGLGSSHVLVQSGTLDVCLARAHEIPRTLLEIGRLREIAFRATGEGSGQHRDLDRFDRHYLHLFLWHRERRAIAGAYRVGATDEILPRLGISGLYTSTLFRFDERLVEQIDPALELGRAFVAPCYQRDYSPLLLLWRGIASYVAGNPRYRMLFGPVSISNSYHSLSRQILARFLYTTSYRADFGAMITPRNPPAFLRHRTDMSPVPGSIVRTLADVGTLLTEIEADQKGVPVLVRQYLKLKAQLLGFNVDPAFGGALDGLMLVDLADVDRSTLVRYMGAERAETFLAFHGASHRRRAS